MLSTYSNDPFLADVCHGRRPIFIASRKSSLALAQVHECVHILRAWHPRIRVTIITTKTKGDLNQHVPLHQGGQDFFTEAVDALVINKTCHLAIHSAKDLPNPSTLPIVALTRSKTSVDLLVYHPFYRKHPLPEQPRFGCSSLRRAELLSQLFPHATIVDIRGTVEERLNKLLKREYDAFVLAKAAAIRLRLNLPYTQELPPPYHPLQGRLGITALRNLNSWRVFLSPLNDFSI